MCAKTMNQHNVSVYAFTTQKISKIHQIAIEIFKSSCPNTITIWKTLLQYSDQTFCGQIMDSRFKLLISFVIYTAVQRDIEIF